MSERKFDACRNKIEDWEGGAVVVVVGWVSKPLRTNDIKEV